MRITILNRKRRWLMGCARRMAARGWPITAIAASLDVREARVASLLGGNALFDGEMMARIAAEMEKAA